MWLCDVVMLVVIKDMNYGISSNYYFPFTTVISIKEGETKPLIKRFSFEKLLSQFARVYSFGIHEIMFSSSLELPI